MLGSLLTPSTVSFCVTSRVRIRFRFRFCSFPKTAPHLFFSSFPFLVLILFGFPLRPSPSRPNPSPSLSYSDSSPSPPPNPSPCRTHLSIYFFPLYKSSHPPIFHITQTLATTAATLATTVRRRLLSRHR